jgi:hypothetical protein
MNTRLWLAARRSKCLRDALLCFAFAKRILCYRSDGAWLCLHLLGGVR